MATLREVASLANVSVATVSHVINNTQPVSDTLTAKVRAAIQQLDYRQDLIARGLKKGRADIVVLILPELESPMYSSIITGVLSPASNHRCSVIQLTSEGNQQKEEELLTSPVLRNCRGLIMLSNYLTRSMIVQRLPPDLPLVTISTGEEERNEPNAICLRSVEALNRQMLRMLSAGYRSIGLIINEYPAASQILQAYFKAMSDYHVPVHLSLIKSESASLNGGYKAMNFLLLQQRELDAVLVCDEAMMLGAVRALNLTTRAMPKDFCFSSITSPNTAFFMPWVKSVVLQTDLVAETAMKLLLENPPPSSNPLNDYFILPDVPDRKENSP